MPPISRDRCSPDKRYIGIGVHHLYDIRSLPAPYHPTIPHPIALQICARPPAGSPLTHHQSFLHFLIRLSGLLCGGPKVYRAQPREGRAGGGRGGGYSGATWWLNEGSLIDQQRSNECWPPVGPAGPVGEQGAGRA